ncbi:hypothetical protein HII36_10430 [Nonomuraea sp. NN258]|uniref:hypothetical protein n=1 Tax=Nonomuraea antri TaxID=2730852 RepID=UPI001569381A|nr:hypothetical protein [Nonomuraea antri]NRQ32249.1 hypothetical protein [Nonomuraea antri]
MRRSRLWLPGIALAALAAAWVVQPLFEPPPPPRFVTTATTAPTQAPALTAPLVTTTRADGPLPPVRYAYVPSCQGDADPCTHWIVVSSDGRHSWLPHGAQDTPLALSHDGTRAAYPRKADGRFVLHDLAANTVKPLPVTAGESVGELFGAQPPLFSRDGRHLLIRLDDLDEEVEVVLRDPVIVDVERGVVRRLPAADRVVGWTAKGLVLMTERRTDDRPGHTTTAEFTVYSPQGAVVGRYALPGNLAWRSVPSPAGATLATIADDLTPTAVTGRGIVLVDPDTGRTRRTVPLPGGWRARQIVRWTDENTLLLRTSDRADEPGHHLLNLATGQATLLDLNLSGAVDLPLQPVEQSVILGAVR